MPRPATQTPRLPTLLVLGAGGRIGRLTVPHFVQRTRGTAILEACPRQGPNGIDILARPDVLTDALARADAVLLLAGVCPGAGDPNVNVALARAVLGAAPTRLPAILCSSVAVYGPGGPFGEESDPAPRTPYAIAKCAMEALALAAPQPVTSLRIGSVAGADSLLGRAALGPVRLDRFPSGTGPRRSYIGPATLARVFADLCLRAARGLRLPPVLNIAAGPPLGMETLLAAAGIPFHWRTAPADAVEYATLDTTRLEALFPWVRQGAGAARIVEEWRTAPRLAAA